MVSLAKMLLVNISSIRNGVTRTFWAQKIALRKLMKIIFYCYCLKVIKHVNFVIFLKAIF